jgi:tRNA A-37 threonylcarbamoyl transferase component Bud32
LKNEAAAGMIEQLGKYRIDGVLGKGAMGVVYKAFDPAIQRTVALKTIRKELFSDSQQAELIGRFKNEAQAAGRLNHPNIVTVYDYGEDSEAAYIAMEFVDGTPLSALMVPDQPTALPRVVAWMDDLLLALDYAHSRGVIHRDIKPSNLLITHSAQVKVGDFGIARIESSTMTHTGTMIGTPSYMSPEQICGQTADARSDVFSAGIVLYQLLTGVRPFAGPTSVVMHKILNEHPAPPSQLVPALGRAWDLIVERALAKSAAGRYPSARAFLDALAALAPGGAPVPAAAAHADDDRTVLAVGLPAFAPAPGPGPATGSGLVSGTITPWKIEALPELEPLLAQQIGPMARLLLKKSAAGAEGMDELCDLLLPHIPSDAGRAQFQNDVALLKRKLDANGTGSGVQRTRTLMSLAAAPTSVGLSGGRTGTAAPVPFDDAFVENMAQRLTVMIGPIARVIAKRAARQTRDKGEFLQLLAGHIESVPERTRFLSENGKT